MEGFPEGLASKYQPRGLVGQGGMGKVFRAWDPVFERDVAVKVMLGGAAARADQRFLREAQLLASLSHPHVLELLDYGVTQGGRPYMVTRFLDGRPLSERLPYPDPRGLARQLMEALDAIHEVGLVHRDLKPANVVVSGDGQLRLIDFGLARSDETPTLTDTGAIPGTMPYLPPEAFRGSLADPAFDWYAFGVVLFEALEGRHPHTSAGILAISQGKDPPAPRFERVDGEGSLSRLARACLDPDPTRRPGSKAEAEALMKARPNPEAGEARKASPSSGEGRGRRGPPVALTLMVAGGAFLAALALPTGDGPAEIATSGPRDGGRAAPPRSASTEGAEVEEVDSRPLERAAAAALSRHGEVRSRLCVVDPDRALNAAEVFEHIEAAGWRTAYPDQAEVQQFLFEVLAWLRAVRAADLRGPSEGPRAAPGGMLASSRPLEVYLGSVHRPLVHLLEDIMVNRLRFVELPVLSSPADLEVEGMVRDLVAELDELLEGWPEPLVVALRVEARTALDYDQVEIGVWLPRLLKALAQGGEVGRQRVLAEAILRAVSRINLEKLLPPSLRRTALETVVAAFPSAEEAVGAEVLGRVIQEDLREVRASAEDDWKPGPRFDRVLDLLVVGAAGRALLPAVLARARRLVALDDPLVFSPGTEVLAQPYLARLEARVGALGDSVGDRPGL